MHRVLDPVLNDEVDYVKGSRYLESGSSVNLPGFRQAAIPAVTKFIRTLTWSDITDATTGYRAFRVDLLRKAQFDWKAPWLYTYGFEYYFLAKVMLNPKIRWREVPITMRYPEKGRPYSKIKPGIGWWHMLKPWLVARIDGKTIQWP